MMWLTEARYALRGVIGVVQGDPGALGLFDVSPRGVVRSFLIPGVIILPLFLLTNRHDLDAQWQAAGTPGAMVILGITYVMLWTAFPVAMITVCRLIDRLPRWMPFVAVANWSSLLVALAVLPITLMDILGVLGDAINDLFQVIILVGVFVLSMRIARVTLALGLGSALMVALLERIIGMMVFGVGAGLLLAAGGP